MNASTLLKSLSDLGVAVSLQEGRIRCRAPRGIMTQEIVQQLKNSEREVVAFISEQPVPINFSNDNVDVPSEWFEGFKRLEAMPLPLGFKERRWGALLADAEKFLDRWAPQIAALGWSTREVYGVHERKPEERLELKGLVPSISGRKIAIVSANSVTIECASGNNLRIFRKPDELTSGRIPLWDLYGEKT